VASLTSTFANAVNTTPARSRALPNQLIESHLGLVRQVVGKLLAHLPAGTDLENLASAGMLGLVEAARKFDPRRGIRFETYSYPRIRGAVLDELRRNCPIPQHKLEQAARVRRACEELDSAASINQLAEKAGLSPDQVADSLAALRLTRILSLDRFDSLQEIGIFDRREFPDTHAEKEEQKRILTEAIEALPERQRLVVTLYYMEDLRLREIGVILHLSESRVSRVLSAGVFAVGQFLRARERRRTR
jgi:RNA polymerase sigma factor FliA